MAMGTSDGAAARQGAQADAGAAPAPAETDAPPLPEIPSDAKGDPQPAAGPPAVPAAPPAVPRKKRPKKFKKPWFEEFFDDDYLRTIPFMTPTYTVKEMEYIRSHLDLPAGARLLDVGCGYGRLAIEFARVGYDVTGLDTSLPLMFLAAEAATAAGVEVNFMHQDMREMSFDNEFDGVYCVMTSFGYFDDETNRDVVGRMHRAVKPGGKLFIEVINRDFILSDLPSRGWWEGDDCVVMDEVEFNFLTSRIVSKRSVVFSDGRSVNYDLSIRAYCLHELGRMLHNVGFRVVSVTGNINTDNRFFGLYSPYLIVLSEKHK
jgi:SAM-dependent methyltransferase